MAVLLALASALVPALFPTGSASPRLPGSAFDPTTSAVALRGQDQTIVQLEEITDDRPGKAVLLPRPAQLLNAIEALRRIGPTSSSLPPPPARRVTQAQPRAPPHARL